ARRVHGDDAEHETDERVRKAGTGPWHGLSSLSARPRAGDATHVPARAALEVPTSDPPATESATATRARCTLRRRDECVTATARRPPRVRHRTGAWCGTTPPPYERSRRDHPARHDSRGRERDAPLPPRTPASCRAAAAALHG